jgi:hypothetical protein
MLNALSSKTDQLLNQLDRVKQTGQGKWLARCPAHDDKSPSLAIKDIDGRILLYCFAGCATSDVVAAVGMSLADLMPDAPYQPGQPRRSAPKFAASELFPLLVQ